MKFKIILNEDDYLEEQLFAASTSAVVKRNRRTTLVMIFALFVVLAISDLLGNDLFLPWWALLLSGMLCVFFYAKYQRNLYISHYRKIIAKLYHNRFGKSSEMEFLDGHVFMKDYIGENKLDLSFVEHINETGQHFFMKFETAEVLILPKRQFQVEEFSLIVEVLCNKHNIPFTQDLNWKWR